MRPFLPPPNVVRFASAQLRALDADKSGAITAKDLASLPQSGVVLEGFDARGTVPLHITNAPQDVGRVARMFAHAKKELHLSLAPPEFVDIPAQILQETAPERALLAADSYEPFLRTTKVPDVLDALLAHPDPKLGVFTGGLVDEHGAPRTYGVVGANGALETRTATYDGKTAFLYVPADAPEADALVKAAKSDPKYAHIEVRVVSRAQLADRDERLAMRFDRPGMFYVSSRCPVLPHVDDDAYVVPGGRFGMELYYHDARINSVSARNTVDAAIASGDRTGAEDALKALRGTASALVNEVLLYGKAMNASMTTSVGRSQAPCLTTVIQETFAAWTALHPDQIEDARTWLKWAVGAAEQEYREVWMSPPRLDEQTGLSRYIDETPSQAPEEAAHFYEGVSWSAQDLQSDAAVREHGWDSMPAALLTDGPDKGKPRMHELLPVCLQSLLYRYERDLADLTKAAGGDASEWSARADKRKSTMDALMWDPKRGVYLDLVQPRGKETSTPKRNGAEDLRSLMPLWAGLLDGDDANDAAKRKAMHARVKDYVRPHGLATATTENWLALFKLNPDYTSRCQWGHKDIGWPIATYETVQGLRRTGNDALADEIAYRWCASVQAQMDTLGGLHPDERGGYTAPIFEKMNVTEGVHEGAAQVGYGNQGAGQEGAGGGFRWGLDAYKLLARSLPASLQDALHHGTDADALFDARVR